MITVIPVANGTYNLFGTRGRRADFVLSGNLTEDELDELAHAIKSAQRSCRNCGAAGGVPCEHDAGCIDSDRG